MKHFVLASLSLGLALSTMFSAVCLADSVKFGFSVVDSETKQPVCGAEFYAVNIDLENVYHAVSGEDGLAIFEEPEDGKYIMFQASAPSGYITSDYVAEVQLPADKDNSDVLITEIGNTSVSVLCTACYEDGTPAANETVILQSTSGYMSNAVTDEYGTYTFKYLPYGDYKLLIMPNSGEFISGTMYYDIKIDNDFCNGEYQQYAFQLKKAGSITLPQQ